MRIGGSGLRPEVSPAAETTTGSSMRWIRYSIAVFCGPKQQGLALALLVARVFADHHDAAVAADDLALVADLLNAGLYLHDAFLLRFAVLVLAGCRESLLSSDLLVAVDDAAAGQIVGSQLHNHAVSGENTDVVLTHLARNVGKDLVSIGQLDSEHCVRQSLNNCTFDLDDAVFFRHSLTIARVGNTGHANASHLISRTQKQAQSTKDQAYPCVGCL